MRNNYADRLFLCLREKAAKRTAMGAGCKLKQQSSPQVPMAMALAILLSLLMICSTVLGQDCNSELPLA